MTDQQQPTTPDLPPGLPAVPQEPTGPGQPTPQPTPEPQRPETDKIRVLYTPKRVDDIVTVLKSGGKRREAYTWARISKSTFHEWMHEIPEFKEAVEAAEAITQVYVITQLWKNIRAGSGTDIRFWLERNVPGWRPAPSTIVKQTNNTTVNSHAEDLKKARQRVNDRTGRRVGPGSAAAK